MKVTLVQYYGSDLMVVNAARVSLGKKSEWDIVDYEPLRYIDPETGEEELSRELVPVYKLKERDERLIRYLARHNHWTPFGHCGATFHFKIPIFVARQLMRHNVGIVWNEISGRYVEFDDEFYFPSEWRKGSKNIKQGSLDETVELPKETEACVAGVYHAAYNLYEELLKLGVCKEQARMVLPLSLYTQLYGTGSLAAWARVCNLRLDKHAQKEIRIVAEQISNYMKEKFPVSWKYLVEEKFNEN